MVRDLMSGIQKYYMCTKLVLYDIYYGDVHIKIYTIVAIMYNSV